MQITPKHKANTAVLPMLAALSVLFAVLLAWPPGIDWSETFYPATRAFVTGHNPYRAASLFANPVYVLALLVPGTVGVHVGGALMRIAALCTFAYVVRKMGGGVLSLVLFLTLPSTILGLWANNIDWIAVLGSVQRTALAAPLLLSKPQIGGALLAFLFVQAVRYRGVRGVFAFFPLIALLALSLLLYGVQDAAAYEYPRASGWNMAAFWWPRGIVLGAVMLMAAIATDSRRLALLAAPYLAPYASLASWGATLIAFVNRWWVMLAIWFTMWAWIFIQA